MTRIFDLSTPIDEGAPEPFPVRVERIGHAEGGDRLGRAFICKKNDPWHVRFGKWAKYLTGVRRIDGSSFPGGRFLSHETVTASVHCGTHVDSPYHFGEECCGRPARKVDELPLEWCYGDGVVLDMTAAQAGGEITPEAIDAALGKINYKLKSGDIPLIMTGADRNFGEPGYFAKFAGLSASAVDHLLNMGVRTIGTDAPSLDRPFGAMVEDYYRTKDKTRLWPAHIFGRDREYCHIERLANLSKLPRPYGFKFACFPVNIKGAGAGWARAVAIFED